MRLPSFLLGLMLTACLAAQEAPRLRNFSPVDYNAQNQNWSLAQSPEGWLYIGNNAGLLEFDGARWRLFTLSEKQTVRAVATGPGGEVFCGGFGEFGFWKTDSLGRFIYHSLSQGVRSGQLGKEEIWHILSGPGFVLFQSFSTIYKFDYQKITVLDPPGAIMFARRVGERVLLPVIGRGLYELTTDNTFRFLPGSEALAGEIVQFLVPGPDGSIWAGTTNHGIFDLKNGRCQPWSNPLNAAFQRAQLNKAERLPDGGWAIGTILDGAFVLDSATHVRYHLHRENGLQNNTVLNLLSDRDGNLWLGLDRGIDLAALHSPLTFFTDHTGKIGTTYTAAFFRQRLYLGTNQGVFTADAKGNFALVEGTQGQVWQLQAFDRQLLCGHNTGTFLLAERQASRISDVTGGWCTVRMPGHADVLVQGTYTGLIIFKRNEENAPWQFSHRVEGFSEPVKKIAFDSLGNLWAAHPNRGVFRLRLTADLRQVQEFQVFALDRAEAYQPDLSVVHGQLLLNSRGAPPRRVSAAMDGHIAFDALPGTHAGQKRLPGIGEDYFEVDSSGLRLVSDKRIFNLGLTLVPGFENVVALSDSAYLFCLEDGFARLDRQRMSTLPAMKNPVLPVPVVRAILSLDGDLLGWGGGAAYVFPWSTNGLIFQFTVPDYVQPPRFSWHLDGFSTAWSPWQTSPEKEFTNLPPGRYTFRVRAVEGGTEAAVAFRIAPPLYRSAWGFLFYFLLVMGGLWVVEKINRRRLTRQRQHLKAEKNRDLARQRTEAEHEKLALEVENKSRELSNAALSLIRKNEVLQHLKDQLLDAGHDPQALSKIVRFIDQHIESDHDWQVFEESFNRVHDDFFKRLMRDYPDLTQGDLRLAAYLKMNLSSKEIAPLLNISIRGVENKRYRLRKKLGLPEDGNLAEFMMRY